MPRSWYISDTADMQRKHDSIEPQRNMDRGEKRKKKKNRETGSTSLNTSADSTSPSSLIAALRSSWKRIKRGLGIVPNRSVLRPKPIICRCDPCTRL